MIEHEAGRRRADLSSPTAIGSRYAERGRLVYQDEDGLLDLPSPRLPGRHQFANAGTAIAALRRAGLAPPAAAIEAGPRQRRLAGAPAAADRRRARRSAPAPAPSSGSTAATIPAPALVIAEAMADLEERAPRPLFLISGMLNTKDPVGFFRPFAGLVRARLHGAGARSSNAGRDPGELARGGASAGLAAEPRRRRRSRARRASPRDRVLAAPPRILICGSLYLAGTVLAENGTPPR